MVKTSFGAVQLRSFDTSGLTGSYQLVGVVWPRPITLLRIVNAADVAVTISYDGVTAHDIILASGTEGNTITLDVGANTADQKFAALRQGGGVYVTGSAGTGLLYVAAYGPNQ